MPKLTREEEKEWDDLDAGKQPADDPTKKDDGTAHGAAAAPAGGAPTGDAPVGDGASSGATTDDPFANLNPQVKDYIVGLQTQAQRDAGRLSKLEGHIGSLKNDLQNLRAKPKEEPPAKASLDPEKAEDLRRDYPELAEGVMALLSSSLAAANGGGQAFDVGGLEAKLLSQVEQFVGAKLGELTEGMTVEITHKGWRRTTESPEFVGWVRQQPREVQQLYVSPHSQDVIRLLDLYKEAGEVRRTSERRLNSAAAISDPGKRRAQGVKAFEDMNEEEQWSYLDNLEAPRRTGTAS